MEDGVAQLPEIVNLDSRPTGGIVSALGKHRGVNAFCFQFGGWSEKIPTFVTERLTGPNRFNSSIVSRMQLPELQSCFILTIPSVKYIQECHLRSL